MNAQDTFDHACNNLNGPKRKHHQRRIALMMYAMPDLEMESAKEARAQVKDQIKGFFDGMARDFAGPFTGNKLRS